MYDGMLILNSTRDHELIHNKNRYRLGQREIGSRRSLVPVAT